MPVVAVIRVLVVLTSLSSSCVSVWSFVLPSEYAGRVGKTGDFVFAVSSSSFRFDVFVSVVIATAALVGGFVPVDDIIVTGGVVADDDTDDDTAVAGISVPWFCGVVFPSVVL